MLLVSKSNIKEKRKRILPRLYTSCFYFFVKINFVKTALIGGKILDSTKRV